MASRSRSRSTLRQASRERPAKLVRSNSSSRACSPAAQNRRVAKLDLYLAKSMRRSSYSTFKPPSEPVEPVHSSLSTHEVKWWDGNRRMTVKWDSIRRDPELWNPNGDCLVHFYERGASRRGASLRVYLADIEGSNCGPLLEQVYSERSPIVGDIAAESNRYSMASEYLDEPSSAAQHELYIPAPSHYAREEAFHYHITTRNFFAWMYERPLVGERLGQALISLQGRMNQYRPNEEANQDDMLKYIDDQGYTDFRHCPDHALAILQYAEKCQFRGLWTDAFVHCTGMNDELNTSGEYEHASRASQALIVRANIEMDVRLERAGRSLGDFLEEDLSGAYLGLGKDAQMHLERFRSFLHTYYVGQHGYWPPRCAVTNTDALPKSVYQSMYFDFRSLYEYLADTGSGISIQDNRPVDGGICVYQNVMAFDKRNKYPSLPHPLPLVPKVPASLNSRKSLFHLFGSSHAKVDRRISASSALMAATNSYDDQVMDNNLVREYLRFEKLWTLKEDTSVSCADARKVRWILIYSILQTIISVTRVPNDVRDTEGVSYPLCCQIGGTPPWPIRKLDVEKPEQESPRPTSLKDLIIELGPDMDNLKPSPLMVSVKANKTPSPPRRGSFVHKLSLKSPKPIRPPSIEFLDNGYGDVSPIDLSDPRPISLGNISPLDFTAPPLPDFTVTPPEQIISNPLEHLSDPSSPSTSETGGSGGWSTSSSEDGMEHASVAESDSNYGDDEDDEEPRSGAKANKPTFKALKPPKRTPSGLSFGRCNPEVEQFLKS